jgi:hypothetical protein
VAPKGQCLVKSLWGNRGGDIWTNVHTVVNILLVSPLGPIPKKGRKEEREKERKKGSKERRKEKREEGKYITEVVMEFGTLMPYLLGGSGVG